MFRPSALALLAASAALAAPVPKGDTKAELYFPIEVGVKRVMGMTGGGATRETTETVTKVEEKDGVYRVSVGRDMVGQAATQVFEVSAKGVSRLTSGGVEAKTPYPLLKLGVKAGDTWTSEFEMPALQGPGGARAIKYTHTMGKEEEVEVPAGKFKALRVDVDTDQDGVKLKSTSWFAAGVGLIKSEMNRGGVKLTQELKEFTPGKGEKKDEPKKDR